jgi:hypothetical protein
MRSPCCLCVWTNIYETRYVHYCIWAHLSDLLHESLPSVCWSIYVPPIVARQRLFKNFTTVTNTHETIEELLHTSFTLRSVSYQRTVDHWLFPRLLVYYCIYLSNYVQRSSSWYSHSCPRYCPHCMELDGSYPRSQEKIGALYRANRVTSAPENCTIFLEDIF